MSLNTSNTPENNYEQIIQNIVFHKPKNLLSQSIQGIHYRGDPAVEVKLEWWKKIILRIWQQHMESSTENRRSSDKWTIFISAYLFDREWRKKHLPLFWWYENNAYKSIWWKVLEK